MPMTPQGAVSSKAASPEQMLKEYLQTDAGKAFQNDMESHMSNIRLMTRRLNNALKGRGVGEAEAQQITMQVIANNVQRSVVEALDVKKATGMRF